MYDFLFLIFLLVLVTFAYGGLSAAPWLPTFNKDIKRILELVDIKKGDVFYDLGCGDGRVLRLASSQGAEAIGFEVSLLPFVIAHIKKIFTKDKFTIKFKSFWDVDLQDADIVYIYLLPKSYPKLKEKLKKELKKGTKIITSTWKIEGWDIKKTNKKIGSSSFYLYEI